MNELIELYKDYWRKYTDFGGRTTVRAFWLTMLAQLVVTIVVGLLGMIPFIGTILVLVYGVACIIPSVSLGARRLRDGGYNPLWLLLYFVPCGAIAVIVLFCMPTKEV